MLTNPLDIGNHLGRRIMAPPKIRMRAPGPALIKQNRMETLRIKQHPVAMLAAAARPAVKKQRRYAVSLPDLLHINPVPVPHIKHDGIERTGHFLITFSDHIAPRSFKVPA